MTAAAGLAAFSSPAHAAPTCNGLDATITGSGVISGTAGNDVIVGSDLADTIDAGDGNDVICAGANNDQVSDGAGKDKVYLEAGGDIFVAHATKDTGDLVDGGDGADTADYSVRTVKVKLRLNTTGGDDGATGERDKLLAMEDALGGAGDDEIVGTDGPNTIAGNSGNDKISDGLGADTVAGGAGDDLIKQGDTIDVGDYLDGGDDVDTISYAARENGFSPIVVDLNHTFGDSGFSGNGGEHDELYEFENANGGVASEHFFGTDGPNVIKAGNGFNGVLGFGGDDTITSGNRDDLVDGGTGINTISLGSGCDTSFHSVVGTDIVKGGAGRCDLVTYRNRIDNVVVDLGSTSAISGAPGENDLFKGFEYAEGGRGDDIVRGTNAANHLTGGPGVVFPPADDGADQIFGLGGDDILASADTVMGNDSIDGGAGSDLAYIDSGDTCTAVEEIA
ncbi:calcium-binding protein [Nocardioides humilatus]|uniref:calcium-binding protein n=1 Tax=Nocardioides humilatus TaxID=2607660 RepID=UPI00165F3728|nr:calcium-binding protein [Nocardioides humilatus]